MAKQIKITELEAAMLNKIAFDLYQPLNGGEPMEYKDTAPIWSAMIIESKQDRGVSMSLVEKGLIGISPHSYDKFNKRNDTTLWFTEAGFAEFRKIQDAKKPIEMAKPVKAKAAVVYTVSYFDTLGGGSGMTRVEMTILPQWLKDHPGYLIRELN